MAGTYGSSQVLPFECSVRSKFVKDSNEDLNPQLLEDYKISRTEQHVGAVFCMRKSSRRIL